MRISIPYMECVIKFNVSSTIIVLLQFQNLGSAAILKKTRVFQIQKVISLVSLDKFISMTLRYFHTKGDLCIMT